MINTATIGNSAWAIDIYIYIILRRQKVLIVLVHGPFLTLYGHLSSIAVRCGQLISAGSVIGGVGSTGVSTGPHLHFEIRYGETPQDPCATLPDVCF